MEQTNLTSVQWLVNEIFAGHTNAWQKEINQALQMEKLQMEESYCQGCKDITDDETIFPRITAEEYYNQKYKQ